MHSYISVLGIAHGNKMQFRQVKARQIEIPHFVKLLYKDKTKIVFHTSCVFASLEMFGHLKRGWSVWNCMEGTLLRNSFQGALCNARHITLFCFKLSTGSAYLCHVESYDNIHGCVIWANLSYWSIIIWPILPIRHLRTWIGRNKSILINLFLKVNPVFEQTFWNLLSSASVQTRGTCNRRSPRL
jgi:hypothetical protein